jgi:hypothetical protein
LALAVILYNTVKLTLNDRRMRRVGIETPVLAVALIFALYTFPTKYMIATTALAIVIFLLTKSFTAILGVVVGAILLRLFIDYSDPDIRAIADAATKPSMYTADNEGFQPKDPISIHQRIASNKDEAPLKPKAEITGVLESPNILDALQLSDVLPSERGSSKMTLPASVKAPEIIPTPAELTPQMSESQVPMIANPMLQNGPDTDSISTALVSKGTALILGNPSSQMESLSMGPSNY